MADTAGYARNSRKKMIMDIEIEKKIEQLEYQRMIDELATESRNKNMNKAEHARQ